MRNKDQYRPDLGDFSESVADISFICNLTFQGVLMADKLALLRSISFGSRIAEDEIKELEEYFVETDQWSRIFHGEIDIVFGAKGAGKSAIYALIDRRQNQLFDRKILRAPAENVSGSTVFQNLITDPPPSEQSFVFLWKLYCLSVIGKILREYDITNQHGGSLIGALENAGLLPADGTLRSMFRSAHAFVKAYLSREVSAVEYKLTIEPSTGMPIATRRAEMRASETEPDLNEIPVDELFAVANDALEDAGYEIWIAFDRLDVAFPENPELEKNALRSLFRVYSDLRACSKISLKIFVRNDLWRRITETAFPEASHITRVVNIEWDAGGLLNLIVKRLLKNDTIVSYLGISRDQVLLDIGRQREVFYRLFPDQIDTGRNPETFDWMIGRTSDGTGKATPRELIHLLDCIRTEQIKRLERGEADPEDEKLFERVVFKEALKEVSKVRYEQTFLAEHSHLRPYTQRLEGEKAEQSLSSLTALWGGDASTTMEIALALVDAGFFAQRGSKEEPSFWVPFLYRDALNLVQGRAS